MRRGLCFWSKPLDREVGLAKSIAVRPAPPGELRDGAQRAYESKNKRELIEHQRMATTERQAGAAIAITVNGAQVTSTASTLAQLLAELGYGESRIATAVNGEFVAAERRHATPLAAGDQIEIVAPRQGG